MPDYCAALTGDVKGLRIGLPKEYFIAGLDPDVQAAIAQVLEAGRRANKPGGIHVIEPDPEALQQRIQAGFNFLGYGLDIRILDSICRTHLQSIRATLKTS